MIVGVVFAVGLGFPVLVVFETPPHEIRIAHAGTKITSEITETKSLFRTVHRTRTTYARMVYARRD